MKIPENFSVHSNFGKGGLMNKNIQHVAKEVLVNR